MHCYIDGKFRFSSRLETICYGSIGLFVRCPRRRHRSSLRYPDKSRPASIPDVHIFGPDVMVTSMQKVAFTELHIQHFVLYPLSFSSLDWPEVTEQPPYHIQPSARCLNSFVHHPSAVYASFIRIMLRYPQHCSTRTNLESDLSELIGYHLLGLKGGYVDADDDVLWEDLKIDKRIADAVLLVRQDEKWIGDALAGVVSGSDGNDIKYLPYKS